MNQHGSSPADAPTSQERRTAVRTPPADLDECAAVWRSRLSVHRALLLLLDNACDD
ncbi:hypothetical protein ACLMNJ_34740 [Streptomyces seoulensis]